jgi:hypothetical protein
MHEDDRRALDMTGSAEAEQRRPERRVEDHREVGRQVVPTMPMACAGAEGRAPPRRRSGGGGESGNRFHHRWSSAKMEGVVSDAGRGARGCDPLGPAPAFDRLNASALRSDLARRPGSDARARDRRRFR